MPLIQAIVIQVVTFLAVIFILKKIMYSASVEEMNRLEKLNKENMEKGKDLTRKLTEAEAEYKTKLAKAQEESLKMKEEAKKEIDKIKEEVLEKARLESERIVQAAVKSKDNMREEIFRQVERKAVDVAVRIFDEAVFPKVKKFAQEELVREVLKEIGQMSKDYFDVRADKLEIISVYELKKEEKNKITESIFSKFGQELAVEFKKDDKLIAGVVIKLGTFVIDAALSSRMVQILAERGKTWNLGIET